MIDGFKGCPHCQTDEYIITVEKYGDTKEEKEMSKEYVEIAVHFGKENNEECHIIIKGTLDNEFLEDLHDLLLLHKYTESL